MNIIEKLKPASTDQPDKNAVPAPDFPGLPDGYDDPAGMFYVPEEARPYYADAKSVGLTRATQDMWREGEPGAWARRVAARGWARHIVAANYGGVVPIDADEAAKIRHTQWIHIGDEFRKEELSDEARAQLEAGVAAELEYGPRFRAEVEALAEEMQALPAVRLTELVTHEHTTREALERARTESERARQHEVQVKKQTCPVCGQHAKDAATGSPVSSRPLTPHSGNIGLPGAKYPVLRSCAFCYDEALAQLREQRASASSLDPKHPTRAAAVTHALAL